MKSAKLASCISFILGAGIGSGITWYFLKTYYEQLNQEDHDELKAHFEEKYSKLEDEVKKESDISEETDPALEEKPDIMAYAAKLNGMGYTNYSGISKEEPEENEEEDAAPEPIMEDGAKPYVIEPEEFGELDGYEKISLTHYSDGTLADIHDNIIDDDVDEIVGSDYADHFGEYEDDSVFIRNDAKKCDYEILYDERTWDEILKAKPYLMED